MLDYSLFIDKRARSDDIYQKTRICASHTRRPRAARTHVPPRPPCDTCHVWPAPAPRPRARPRAAPHAHAQPPRPVQRPETRLHARGGGRCSEQFKRSLERKITHSALNKSCFTNDSESIEHPSVNHEKFGRYGTSGTCRGGGISSVKVERAEIAPKSAVEAACHPENTCGPSIDRSRATCGPKRSLSSLGTT